MCALKSLISRVFSTTSGKVFLGTKTWGLGGGGRLCFPNFCFGGTYEPPPPTPPPMKWDIQNNQKATLGG